MNYFNVFAKDVANVGEYVVKVTVTLDNIAILSDKTNLKLDASQKIDLYNLPADFIYTNEFLMTFNITETNQDAQFINSKPFFAPVPYDTWVYVGDRLSLTFGKALDPANNIVEVAVYLGDASKFASYDKVSNTISIKSG